MTLIYIQLCSQIKFLYNEKVYKQVDGVAMGSPLAPLLANWFIASKENTQNNVKTKPIFYTIYVDEIFIIIENNHDLDTF